MTCCHAATSGSSEVQVSTSKNAPPGLITRAISCIASSSRWKWWGAVRQVTRSIVPLRNGRFSAAEKTADTLSSPLSAAASRVTRIIPGAMSVASTRSAWGATAKAVKTGASGYVDGPAMPGFRCEPLQNVQTFAGRVRDANRILAGLSTELVPHPSRVAGLFRHCSGTVWVRRGWVRDFWIGLFGKSSN